MNKPNELREFIKVFIIVGVTMLAGLILGTMMIYIWDFL